MNVSFLETLFEGFRVFFLFAVLLLRQVVNLSSLPLNMENVTSFQLQKLLNNLFLLFAFAGCGQTVERVHQRCSRAKSPDPRGSFDARLQRPTTAQTAQTRRGHPMAVAWHCSGKFIGQLFGN